MISLKLCRCVQHIDFPYVIDMSYFPYQWYSLSLFYIYKLIFDIFHNESVLFKHVQSDQQGNVELDNIQL